MGQQRRHPGGEIAKLSTPSMLAFRPNHPRILKFLLYGLLFTSQTYCLPIPATCRLAVVGQSERQLFVSGGLDQQETPGTLIQIMSIGEIFTMSMQDARTKHQCPDCKFFGAARSIPRGIVERLMASLIHVRPYRCASCDRRFYSKQSRPAQSAR
jgi:hypothetical protein